MSGDGGTSAAECFPQGTTAEDGTWSFGAGAVEHYSQAAGQGRLIRSIKKYLPDESFMGTAIGGRKMSLVDIVSMFLRNLREKANSATGLDVETVVLGRPAVFSLNKDKDQLAANRLRAAALQAGFKDIHFCPEPAAAGLAIDADDDASGKTYLICDFGGGTSDYSVICFRRGETFEVLSIGGVSLAGGHYDGSIMKHMVSPLLGADITYKMPMGRNTLRLPQHIVNKLCSAPDINFIGHTEAFELLQAIRNCSHSSGGSLLSVLMAAGIFGIVAVAMARMQTFGFKAQNKLENDAARSQIRNVISERISCEQTLQGIAPGKCNGANGASAVIALKDKSGDSFISGSGDATKIGDFAIRAICNTAAKEIVVRVGVSKSDVPLGTGNGSTVFIKDPMTEQLLDWAHPKNLLYAPRCWSM